MSQTRLLYNPPRALRLGQQPSGAGLCARPGSGDTGCEAAGNLALAVCSGPGNNAGGGAGAGGCTEQGNAAAWGGCDIGNAFVSA
jgi:hypothetical protein